MHKLRHVQHALNAAGAEAESLRNLWWIFFSVCAVVYTGTIGFFVAAWFRGRRNATPIVREDKRLMRAVGAATVVSIVGLLALLVISVAVGHTVGTFGTRANPMEIDVTGHQWWWEVKYPAHGLVTANEIHIPIHTPVLLRLDSPDVIHSLWIPNLHGKRDLIPGRVNKLIIEADHPGIFRGQCAEFCGLQHAHMSLTVIAEGPEQFAKWEAHQSEGAPAPMTPEEARGQQAFLGSPCVKCHNVTGTGANAKLGPDLTHFRSRPTLAAGLLLNTRGNVAGWILNAPAIKPGTQMPANQISAVDLQDLLAYLDTLR